MTRLWLVRHGRAAAGWGDDPDPGLDAEGRAQAEAVADRLAPLGPLPMVTSPLRRTRDTAAPLAGRWGVDALVEPAVAEIPSPTDELDRRAAWLEGVLGSSWSALAPDLGRWRDDVVGWVRSRDHDTVVVTHFVAINAVIGAATDDDRVVCRLVGNGSITVVDVADGVLALVELDDERASEVR